MVRQVVRQARTDAAILGMLFELAAGHHDGHGRFGDEVIGEGAEEDAVFIEPEWSAMVSWNNKLSC